MARSRLALLLLLAAQGGLFTAVAAFVPRATPESTSSAAYFPTAVGTKWVYCLTESGTRWHTREYERIQLITAVTEKDGVRFVTVTESGNYDAGSITEWSVSEAGLRHRSLDRDEARAWYTVLPAQIAPGVTWTEDIAEERSRIVQTVVGWEVVRVPAGVYRAVRIEFVEEHPHVAGKIMTGAWWYVPGIGCVKHVVTGRAGLFEIVEELVAFQPGGGS
jgi:hypothetical protein